MTQTIGQILPVAARRFGNKIALQFEKRAFTFQELETLSNQVANGLVSRGVQPGDRVTLYGPNCWEWLVAYYAISKTGAVVNPINVMLTPEEVRYVVQDSGARVVIASSDKGGPLLDMNGSANLSDVVLWGETVPDGVESFADFLRLGSSKYDVVQRLPCDLAAICYTSGTTGHPKGAMLSHRAVIGAGWGLPLWRRVDHRTG